MTQDPLSTFKANQKQHWGLFAPLEAVTTICAAELVHFADIQSHELVLDVGCGTGVVAITAAKRGASVMGIDLSPTLLEHAYKNASLAKVNIDFKEGDVEALPYPDSAFDVVLSQFGHMFAPRPQVAIAEMLRVLKPGGKMAFSTWPPDLFVGRLFSLVGKFTIPVEGVSSPSLWGAPQFVREQLGNQVRDLVFDQGMMRFPALSLAHYRETVESTGLISKVAQDNKNDPTRLAQFRAEVEALAAQYYRDNYLHQHYLMSRAYKAR